MKDAGEGFYLPHIDTETCINCGACSLVCPTKSITEVNDYLKVKEIMKKYLRGQSFDNGLVFDLLYNELVVHFSFFFQCFIRFSFSLFRFL